MAGSVCPAMLLRAVYGAKLRVATSAPGAQEHQSARSLDNGAFGRERIMSQLFGPTVGTFNSAFQAL